MPTAVNLTYFRRPNVYIGSLSHCQNYSQKNDGVNLVECFWSSNTPAPPAPVAVKKAPPSVASAAHRLRHSRSATTTLLAPIRLLPRSRDGRGRDGRALAPSFLSFVSGFTRAEEPHLHLILASFLMISASFESF